MTQSFLEAIQLDGTGSAFRGELDESWYQGRGGFGGVVSALMLHGIEKALGEAQVEVKSTQITFCAPLLAEPFQVEIETIRRGSAGINMLARVVQGNEIKSMMVAMLGRFRSSAHDFCEGSAPEVPGPREVPTVPFGPMFPAFAQHFEFKFA